MKEQLSQQVRGLSLADVENQALNDDYSTPPIPTALAILRHQVLKLIEEA